MALLFFNLHYLMASGCFLLDPLHTLFEYAQTDPEILILYKHTLCLFHLERTKQTDTAFKILPVRTSQQY